MKLKTLKASITILLYFLLPNFVFANENDGVERNVGSVGEIVFSQGNKDCKVTAYYLPSSEDQISTDQGVQSYFLDFSFTCEGYQENRFKFLNLILEEMGKEIHLLQVKDIRWSGFNNPTDEERIRAFFLGNRQWCDYAGKRKLFPYNNPLIPEIMATEMLFPKVAEVFHNNGIDLKETFVAGPVIFQADEHGKKFPPNEVCDNPSFPLFSSITYVNMNFISRD